MADQLVTVNQVKARLGIAVGDATDDVLLGELIDQVTEWIQDEARRKLVPDNAATYVVDTLAGYRIYVPRGIRTVTSLGIATTDQPDSGGTYVAVTLSTILLRPSAVDRRPGWPATELVILATPAPLRTVANGARIVGDFGFAAAPARAQGVAIDAVVTAYTDRRAGTSGAIGATGAAVYPWSTYFAEGSPQLETVRSFRPVGIA